MRTNLDLTPMFRSSIGFDRIFDVLENASRVTANDNWPPYDIVKTGEDDYRITMAVAGFTHNELDITQEHNMLTVTGQKASGESGEFLHHGIAARQFRRRFELADFVKVANATLENGLLTIEVKRELPEAMRPRRIAITTARPDAAKPQQIEAEKQAA
ncbi:Hsp20 family protein [Mesorhizobium sp. B4-1-3]|uniref:Hsp20 family protein n=1 Tax=Mesorhizobium sp. B4-1-3 TaxID=2589889 RepID=UPI001128FCA7|nr:Hsp20 family protein [Mesorhizobium sp. B4-1-3]TPI11624.1 Hsp20 family protein [Mesorhizobium sp. B4-1-3]